MTDRTPESMMDEIVLRMKEIEELEQKIEDKKLEIDNLAIPLRNQHPDFVAMLSTKTGHKGKFYAIKSRFNDQLKRQVAYVCGSDVPFGSWLKKENRKKKEDGTVSNQPPKAPGGETP